MATAQYPGWSGYEGAASLDWNRVWLGGYLLPGLWIVSGFKLAVDIQTKTAKDRDGTSDTDKGEKPAPFELHGTLLDRPRPDGRTDWMDWIDVLPLIHPLRPGRARQPLAIIHPDPNSMGIDAVRVLEIRYGTTTARSGKQIVIQVQRYYPETKAVDRSKSKTPKQAPKTYFPDPGERGVNTAEAARTGFGTRPDPADADTVLDRVMTGTLGDGGFEDQD